MTNDHATSSSCTDPHTTIPSITITTNSPLVEAATMPNHNEHTVHFRVEGMMCQRNCGMTVQNALLKAVPEYVTHAEASFASSSAKVVVSIPCSAADDDVFGDVVEELVDAVECVGFDCEVISELEALDLEKQMKANEEKGAVISAAGKEQEEGLVSYGKSNTFSILLSVSGMSCAVCTGRVESILLSDEIAPAAVVEANVILAMQRAKVTFDKRILDIQSVLSSAHGTIGSFDEQEDEIDHFILKAEEGKNTYDRKTDCNKDLSGVDMERLGELCANLITNAGYECHVLNIVDHDNVNGSSFTHNGGLSLQENADRLEAGRIAELSSWKTLFLVALIFTAPIVFVNIYASHHTSSEFYFCGLKISADLVMMVLATPVQFGVGRRFYIAAYKGMQGGVIGMDFLVVMGTTAAYVYSVIIFSLETVCGTSCTEGRSPTFETGAMLLTFVTFGKFLESYARGKTASALQTLMHLQPSAALRVTDEDNYKYKNGQKSLTSLSTNEVPLGSIKLDDLLLVHPGSRVPTDGILVGHESNGRFSYVDESALSGEPFPVAKGVGDPVYGSCVNQLSVILVKVTATGGDTFLARIVKLIEDAQASKAPIQAIADRVASKFAPVVMMLSAITFVGWMIFNPTKDKSSAFYSALMSAISVIVIACPCALGLATPTAVMVGTGVGASNGLLIKGGAVLEKASTVKTVIFDKTGTLTTGRAVLGDQHFVLANDYRSLLQNCPSNVTEKNVTLWLASCAESCSEHPLGKAIFNAARSELGGDPIGSNQGVKTSSFKVEPGCGVECVIGRDGVWESQRIIRVGTKSWAFDENTRGDKACNLASEMRMTGQIVVYVSVACVETSHQRQIVGVLGVVDPIKDEARQAVNALKDMGLEVWMCTGDHDVTANAVARQVGIESDNICANVKPSGKADLVTRLQKRKEFFGGVAVVGDGINDAIALARADVGLAIGAGTEVAVEAADIVLVRSSLKDVVIAFDLAKVVFRRIQWNFVWALAYNLCALPVAMGILYPFTSWKLPPAFAGLMMAFSSVSVVGSSLLLNFYDKPKALKREKEQISFFTDIQSTVYSFWNYEPVKQILVPYDEVSIV